MLSPEVMAKLMADGPVTLTPEEAATVMKAAQQKPTLPLNRKQRRALSKKGKRRG